MNLPVLFLDANVPMYATGGDHPLKPACAWIMHEATEGRLPVAIDTELVQEILHRYGAIRRWDLGVEMAETLLDIVPAVFPVETRDVRRAIDLVRRYAPRGITSRHVVHAAVMLNNGLTHILSADEHFDIIEGITRIKVGTLDETRSDLQRLADAAH